MQIGEMIRTAAQRYRDSIALSCEGVNLSFKQFDAATDRLGNGQIGRAHV